MRGTPAELAALVGQRVESIRRRGKFLLIDLDRDEIACNPMLTGRFQLAAPGDKLPAKTAFVLGFGERSSGPADAAAWTARRRLASGRRRATGGPLSGPDPDGQGLPPTGRRRPPGARSGRAGAGSRCRRPGAHPRGLARADPPAPGRAQEPVAQPVVRGRHRQRLQRRDPARRRPAARSASAPAWRPRRSMPSMRRRARRWPMRSTSCASASRRRSRSRSATSSRSTTRAASRVRAAGRGSPRSRPAGSSPRTAAAASAEAAEGAGGPVPPSVPADRRIRGS